MSKMCGGDYASNSVNAGVNLTVDVVVSATQVCTDKTSQSQVVSIFATNGSSVTVGDIDFTQAYAINQQCFETSTTQESVNNAIDQAISQAASAMAQQFSFFTGAEARQNASLWSNLGDNIKDSYSEKCKTQLSQTQYAWLDAADQSTINVGTLQFNQSVANYTNCILNDSSVITSKNAIVQHASQKASAKTENFFGPLIAAVMLIIIVFVVLVLGGVREIFSPQFIISIILLVLVYLGVAYALKITPFASSNGGTGSNS